MKKRLSRMLAGLLTLTLLVPSGVMAASGDPAASAKGLKEIAAEKAALLTEQYGTISVQYALIDNGEIKASGQSGMNDIEGKIPLTKDTMYGIGSTSKVFTTAAVMKLVEAGKINLDTPLVQYIPEFKMKDERYKKITPRMLLNHSSGLQGSSLGNAFLFEDNDTYAHDTLLEQLSTQTLKADPGAFSVYCNDGFTLAEILVERVSGKDFTAFIHEHFTQPLGMNHTKTSQDDLDLDQMAGLYYPTYPEQLPNETVNVIGTGGIYSTAEDLVKFGTIFTGEAEGILSESSLRAMEQEEYKRGLWPEDADNSFDFGLGWDSVRLYPFNDYGMKALVKGGDTILYHASLIVLPEQDMAAAVLSSGGSSSTNQLLATQLLLHALKEKGTIKEFKPDKSFGKPVQAELPSDLLKYDGYYGASKQQIRVKLDPKGVLSLSVPQVPNYPEEKYIYTKDGAFVDEAGTIKASFVTEDNGRTYLWVRQYATVPELGQVAISQYLAEKLDENKLTPDVEAAWSKREGKTYYPLNEKYTSIAYFMMKPTMQIARNPELKGYVLDMAITDRNRATTKHNVPGTGSRDTLDIEFTKEKGVEYFNASGTLYMSEDGIKSLYKGKRSTVTIQSDGYAKWYTVPKGAEGKTLTVTLPAEGAFAVYDELGTVLNYSLVSGSNEVKLPENGTIVFAGAPGSVFGVQLK